MITQPFGPAFFDAAEISLDDFRPIVSQIATLDQYPLADSVEQNVVVYDGVTLRGMLGSFSAESKIIQEWTTCLKDGPGVFVIRDGFEDVGVIDRCTAVFEQIVAEEKAAGAGQGDHFGNNERIWNSLQKVAEKDADLFIDYYGNPLLAMACRAWLGPLYQMTAQMNNVKPGGKAQSAHRDYHLGFQSRSIIQEFPAHAQLMSQYLTLQGGIAHCDMPLEKGPTLFLPFSHQYERGYLAFRSPEFAAYFDENKVQLPLMKGDMAFFSPALFHAGGNNRTESDRMVNLVQVSSAFGRTMETINQRKMIEAVYETLLNRRHAGQLPDRLMCDVIATLADGYSFPTNLDSDPPIGGNAPQTQQQMVSLALDEKMALLELQTLLDKYDERRKA